MVAITQSSGYDVEQLDAFHRDLLPALARGLDVRGILHYLSGVASRLIPHDEANLALLTEDGSGLRLYSTASDEESHVPPDAVDAIIASSEPQLVVAPQATERGLRSGLRAPVMMDDRVVGALALHSRHPRAYSTRDLVHVQRLAGYLSLALAHQRLVEQALNQAIELDRAAQVESSVELLHAIADGLDIRSLFPRVSEIAGKVLPHDAMVFFDEYGRPAFQAKSTDEFPDVQPQSTPTPLSDALIIDDLMTTRVPVASGADPTERLLAAGYRSVLGVTTRARDQVISVAFFWKRPHAFDRRDVPIARRIADHIALAVSHEQLAEAARQVAEARGRAEQLEARVEVLTHELEARTHGRIVGESPAWRDALRKATQVAATDTTVLLTGDSGTGKEVVARLIHRASARRKGPFIAINCAALPEQLLESELFGYERGAFTSAQQAKPGQLELASGGVLFLDEVSDMSLPAQAKFLRVLQEREFQRLGGTRTLKANVRVVAATNRDLRRAVERGDFREDLFYRLQVFDIHMSPLRERREDILPLSEAFLQDIGKSFGRPPAGLTRVAREALLAYDWPGNVRELRNALERAAIVSEGGLINTEHLALRGAVRRSAGADPRAVATGTSDLHVLERDAIARVLRECRWNKSKAAKRLGLSRTQLYFRIRKYALEAPPEQMS